MNIKEMFFNIFGTCQNLVLFSTFNNFNQSKKQKTTEICIKEDCIYHKYWYEPVHNFSKEPKHIQVNRCAFGLLDMGGCNPECISYTPLNPEYS